MLIMYGKPVSSDDPDTLSSLYIQGLKDLYLESVHRGYTKKQLKLKLGGVSYNPLYWDVIYSITTYVYILYS